MKALIGPFGDKSPQIDETAWVAPGAVVIGDVTIGPGTSIWFGVAIRGDDHFVKIGARTNVQDGTVIHVTLETNPTIIGDEVTIGHGARLHGCTLEDGCLVGIGAVVLDGAVIEKGAMVAAGALVTPGRRVPAGELWGGSPARKLRDMGEQDRAYLQWDVEHYAKITPLYKDSYPG
ncbi:MAG: gamma carbonic anhydrase family protein [Rhodospirillaceae bacterium]